MALAFKYHELNARQVATGLNLVPQLRMQLENFETEVVEQKLRLNLNLNDVQTYAQSEAYLRGKMDMLRELLHPTAEPTQPLISEEHI